MGCGTNSVNHWWYLTFTPQSSLFYLIFPSDIDGARTEFSIAVGAFKIVAVLVDSRGEGLLGRVFTGCMNIAGRAAWSAVPLVVLHANTALVVDFVDAGSLEALGITIRQFLEVLDILFIL